MHLAQLLFQLEDTKDFSPPSMWLPRPAPSRRALIMEELRQRNAARSAIGRFARRAVRHPVDTVEAAVESASGVIHALEDALHPRADAPFNGRVGPHRRCDWCTVRLDEIRDARKRHGATVNDFALAALAGGLRRFLYARDWEPDGRDLRVCIPVAVREPKDDFSRANSVSAVFLTLPIDESDPVRRLQRVEEASLRLKRSGASEGTDLLLRLGDATRDPLVTRLGVEIANAARPFNLIVTNVRGPDVPLYLLGARMRTLLPMVPLFADQGLSVAIASYCGSLNFGISADWGLMPDVHRLREDIEAAVDELVAAAG
jgi:WS/DGAT/MGAT family acyltransferase